MRTFHRRVEGRDSEEYHQVAGQGVLSGTFQTMPTCHMGLD